MILTIVIASVLLAGCAAPNPPAAPPAQQQSAGHAEVWRGHLEGKTVGAFVCVDGTDSYYAEKATLQLDVPAPGLVEDLQAAQGVPFTVMFSNDETGIEANGLGCAKPPSVFTNSVHDVMVHAHAFWNQVHLEADSALMPGHFIYATGNEEWLNSRHIILRVEKAEPARVSGTWQAYAAESNSATGAGGEFVLELVS